MRLTNRRLIKDRRAGNVPRTPFDRDHERFVSPLDAAGIFRDVPPRRRLVEPLVPMRGWTDVGLAVSDVQQGKPHSNAVGVVSADRRRHTGQSSRVAVRASAARACAKTARLIAVGRAETSGRRPCTRTQSRSGVRHSHGDAAPLHGAHRLVDPPTARRSNHFLGESPADVVRRHATTSRSLADRNCSATVAA